MKAVIAPQEERQQNVCCSAEKQACGRRVLGQMGGAGNKCGPKQIRGQSTLIHERQFLSKRSCFYDIVRADFAMQREKAKENLAFSSVSRYNKLILYMLL